MGTWNTKIGGNDAFLDVYQNFFELYNNGEEPTHITNQILENYADAFVEIDDRNNSLFALALAQWETKSLDPSILRKIKAVIESGDDLRVWKDLGADEKTLGKRKTELIKFLSRISSEKEKPKRRVRPKFKFTTHEIININSPDNKKTFTISEHYTNDDYIHTGSVLAWNSGGGSILYFIGQGKFITAKWINSQTLEIIHDRNIVFTKKDDRFYFCGDEGSVIYSPI
jgi:hypothetical protein